MIYGPSVIVIFIATETKVVWPFFGAFFGFYFLFAILIGSQFDCQCTRHSVASVEDNFIYLLLAVAAKSLQNVLSVLCPSSISANIYTEQVSLKNMWWRQ